jgi:ribosomal protein S18 acetylase RimI-like enzyme
MVNKTAAYAFKIREAVLSDVIALSELHVQTFNETHGSSPNNPTYETRKYQWQQLLQNNAPGQFCFVIENENKELVGFARGIPYEHQDHSKFKGELNKIYLLNKYHRLGLGRKLIYSVAQRFISQNIFSMLLFGDANNKSNGFYEIMGAEKLFANNGAFHGGYGWSDLTKLVAAGITT